MSWQVLTRVNDEHREFWALELANDTPTGQVRYGSIGANGRRHSYELDKALSARDRKLRQGYTDLGKLEQPSPSVKDAFMALYQKADTLEESLEAMEEDGEADLLTVTERLFPNSTGATASEATKSLESLRAEYRHAAETLFDYVGNTPIEIITQCIHDRDGYFISINTSKLSYGASSLFFMNILAVIADGNLVTIIEKNNLRGTASYGTFWGHGDKDNQVRVSDIVYPNPNADVDGTEDFVCTLTKKDYETGLTVLRKIQDNTKSSVTIETA